MKNIIIFTLLITSFNLFSQTDSSEYWVVTSDHSKINLETCEMVVLWDTGGDEKPLERTLKICSHARLLAMLNSLGYKLENMNTSTVESVDQDGNEVESLVTMFVFRNKFSRTR